MTGTLVLVPKQATAVMKLRGSLARNEHIADCDRDPGQVCQREVPRFAMSSE